MKQFHKLTTRFRFISRAITRAVIVFPWVRISRRSEGGAAPLSSFNRQIMPMIATPSRILLPLAGNLDLLSARPMGFMFSVGFALLGFMETAGFLNHPAEERKTRMPME